MEPNPRLMQLCQAYHLGRRVLQTTVKPNPILLELNDLYQIRLCFVGQIKNHGVSHLGLVLDRCGQLRNETFVTKVAAYQKVTDRAKALAAAITLAGQDIAPMPSPKGISRRATPSLLDGRYS